MKRYELIVVGAGPAGLSAAIEAAKSGVEVIVIDENQKPGGQLFKQIHKFFGSKEHKAKKRGFHIGKELLDEADQLGVVVLLNSIVIGIYDNKEITVMNGDNIIHIKGDAIIVSTGASENVVPFPGWTLPGVIGAGAAQTMMNLHGIKPGNKILILGSGNVGLVVGYQLLQAGCQVVAMVDAAPRVGGYGVHASKIARCSVPFFLSHTIIEVIGKDRVEAVVIAQVDSSWNIIKGSEKKIEADTICMAVGLSPMSQLLKMSGCHMIEDPKKGGLVPLVNEYCETSIHGIYASGDVTGIEEASSAMIEGRISGASAANRLGYTSNDEFLMKYSQARKDLSSLRQGMFSPENKGRTDLVNTDEGYPISRSLLNKGYIDEKEIPNYPGMGVDKKGIHPIIECTQNIPCNPCQDACKFNCIKIGDNITSLPIVDEDSKCTGCGMCVSSCSGQAIFLLERDENSEYVKITMPYEFLPLPQIGDKGIAVNRKGEELCEAEVVAVKTSKVMDKTNLLTIKVPVEMSMKARFYKSN